MATTIGERIRELRTGAKLTQSELGRRAQTDKSQISRYEAGTIHPSMVSLHRLALAFEVTVSELLKGVEE